MTAVNKPNLRHYWILFGVVLFSFGFPLRMLSHWWVNPILYGLLTAICLMKMIQYIRRYHAKQAIAVVFPILRQYWIIFGVLLFIHWIDPKLYMLGALAYLLLLIWLTQRYNEKQTLMIVMLICVMLSGWQSLISATEIDNCWIEDNRYTQLILCDSGGQYQQIESLPIGMQGYCYYCPWYE